VICFQICVDKYIYLKANHNDYRRLIDE